MLQRSADSAQEHEKRKQSEEKGGNVTLTTYGGSLVGQADT